MKKEPTALTVFGECSLTEDVVEGLKKYAAEWEDLVGSIEIADRKIVVAFGRQASILYEIENHFGKNPLKAFCSKVGVSDRQLRNYRQVFRLVGMEIIDQLSQRQAKELIQGLDMGLVEIVGNDIVFQDDASVSINAENMSIGQFTDLIASYRQTKTRALTAEKNLEKVQSLHEQEMDTVLDENRKLKRLLQVTRMEGSVRFDEIKSAIDPIIAGMKELVSRVATLDDPAEKIGVAELSNNLISLAREMRIAVGFSETNEGTVWTPEMAG